MASQRFVGSIDQGTSSTRFMLFDIATGQSCYSHQIELKQINYTDKNKSGWAEHDPMEILAAVHTCYDEVLKKAGMNRSNAYKSIAAIGITNQRETTVMWSRSTGLPLHNALVWHDTRTAAIVDAVITNQGQGNKDFLRHVCGLPVSTYFSAMKLLWLRDNSSAVAAAIASGDCLFGTIDTWLLYNLTGGSQHNGQHITDVTNASRTMLMSLQTLQWDAATCLLLGVDMAMLPEIRSSSEIYGYLYEESSSSNSSSSSDNSQRIPISSLLGDQQAALLGQLCLTAGSTKNTYGTGAFLLLNTGTTAVASRHGLLTTVAYQLGAHAYEGQDDSSITTAAAATTTTTAAATAPIGRGPCYYALEGSIPVAGSAIQWLRDSLQLSATPTTPATAASISALAATAADNGNVYFVTAFSGLFSPHWCTSARGTVAGITHATTAAQLCRATLEAAAWQTREVVEAMEADCRDNESSSNSSSSSNSVSSSLRITHLTVDGGMMQSELLAQFQADVLQLSVIRPASLEATAAGAAYAAALAAGVVGGYSNVQQLCAVVAAAARPTVFVPVMRRAAVDAMYRKWKKVVNAVIAMNWAADEPLTEEP